MQLLSFQKVAINHPLVDEVSFGDIPYWLCEMLVDDAMSGGSPCMNCLFPLAFARYGDWLQAYATAWIGDHETLVVASTNREAASEFAKDYGCGVEVLASDVDGVGEVLVMTESPSIRVLDVTPEAAVV